ncbi:MAG: 3'-5' exonuclease, partial [Boseongicola sp.]|nr:3'-5' exonuclease [Boseongicola sp.]NNL18913.1 3'-5' exonuclease [Boseongicola sp.]
AEKKSIAARPLVFDFDLMNASESREISDTRLSDLCFVPFDTETTGLSVENDAIVQLGAVRVLKGRIVEGEVLDTFVNPGRPIPPASTKIHSVTDTDVSGAPEISSVGQAFHHFARGAVLVAHNAPFDIGILRKFQGDIGVEWDHPVLDTVLLSSVVFGINEQHSLDALCERLSIEIPSQLRHTALGDARATAEALVKMLPLLEGKGFRTFGELVQETRKHGRLLHDLNE